MLKHIWSVLCRRSVVDSETNNVSLYDIFEQLTVSVKVDTTDKESIKTVNIPIEYEVVSLWLKEDKEKNVKANLEIEILSPNGENKTFSHTLELPSGMRRLRSRNKITGMSISMPGDYIFKVRIKEKGQSNFKTVAELPLEVNFIKQIEKEKQGFVN